MPGHTILLVEDDQRLADLVAGFLARHGFRVRAVASAEAAEQQFARLRPDLCILDIHLDGPVDGLSLCRGLRARFDGPLLFLTARVEDEDELASLAAGADDFLRKPVKPEILLARLRALLRRAGPRARVEVGALRIDPRAREVRARGQVLALTDAEFDLLCFLATRAGRVVSREELVWGLRGIPYDGLDRSMDVRVSKLRRKLSGPGANAATIKSVRGAGYLLVPAEAPR
ncbi:DNA-binding response regulator [Plesiocystis pacifica SIR-1]|uniref:DNA-binding response regulator n=1 Tax=Plesiocystis pacifica SIR-1 TaxID=391625 RepID=A6G5C1_9BACT|nr:response regulator [Plesiocystis pacifica]EDM78864.1 DNA-binding response regulator [Plesiocystis pacifica SIR-1]